MLTIPSVHPYLMTLLLEDPSEREQLTALTHDSWTTIIEEAIAQRLAALLFRQLNHSNDQHLVPSHVLQRLTQQMVQQTAWNLLLTNELEHILTACQTRGITCIPIRGPVFAEQLYGDCSMRQMDDLDILVHREDLSAIRDMFDQFGYLRHEQQAGFLEAFSYSLEFIHPQHALIVEPHWTLAYPPFVAATDMAPVWARTVKQQWMNRETWALGQEDLLLHLCLHLLHKGEHAPLLWYYELDRLIHQQHSRLDWNIFVHHAQEIGQANLVADVLATVRHHLHSTIPDSIIRRLLSPSRPSHSIPLRPIRDHMLAQPSLYGREEFTLLCSLQGFRQKIHYTYALLFPSVQFMTQRYGLSSPMGLIRSYIARAWHLSWQGCKLVSAWLLATLATRQN